MIGRYQTKEIAGIWDNEAIFERWTQVEVAACQVFANRGQIPADDMNCIRERAHHQSAARVREIEKQTNHDVVAFVRAVGESVGEPASRHLHRGLTSSDVIDTALAIGLTASLDVIIAAAMTFQQTIAKQAKAHRLTPCIGRTHGIHAEPTTFGLKLAGWHSEMSRHIKRLKEARTEIAYGKLSGAVGHFSQTDPEFEAEALELLGLKAEPVATQVVPRDRHAQVFSALALLGAGMERFATEVRAMQRSEVHEAEEAFRPGQTGSSAMPHKRNPIVSERLCGMARLLRGYLQSSVENIALWHERDISHSSVERVSIPDAFHVMHYMLLQYTEVIGNLQVWPEQMRRNIDHTGGLVFSQNVLGRLLATGMDRTTAYRLVQRSAMRVWEGKAACFKTELEQDPEVTAALDTETLEQAFDVQRYFTHVDALLARAGID